MAEGPEGEWDVLGFDFADFDFSETKVKVVKNDQYQNYWKNLMKKYEAIEKAKMEKLAVDHEEWMKILNDPEKLPKRPIPKDFLDEFYRLHCKSTDDQEQEKPEIPRITERNRNLSELQDCFEQNAWYDYVNNNECYKIWDSC